MKDRRHSRCRTMLGSAILLVGSFLILAADGRRNAEGPPGRGGATNYDLTWHTVDGGGVMFSTSGDGQYELSGTIGQPDAGTLANAEYELTGGFWFAIAPGDCNTDGGVNLVDFDDLLRCLSGAIGGPLSSDCACFDMDGDDRVDLRDYGIFQSSFSGS